VFKSTNAPMNIERSKKLRGFETLVLNEYKKN